MSRNVRRTCIAAVGVMAVIGLSCTAASASTAQAGPASLSPPPAVGSVPAPSTTQAPANTTYYIWGTVASDAVDTLRYDSTEGEFLLRDNYYTELSAAFDCSNGWCEHETTGGQCLTYIDSGDYLTLDSCNGAAGRLWYIGSTSDGSYYWYNQYSQNHDARCPGGYDEVMTGIAGGATVVMGCPDAGTGYIGTDQQWLEGLP
jgi:hypothetical protein